MRSRTAASYRIVGRDRELGVASSFLDGLQDSHATLHIEGEAGIGKTTYWHNVLELAAARGLSVLQTRPTASDAALPYAGLTDLLGGAYDELTARLPSPQRRALDAALLRAQHDGGAPDQRAVATGFLTLLGILGGRAAVVVAVDDAQWLDSASIRVLEFAARRVDGMPIGMVVSSRPESDPPAFVRAAPDGRVTRIRLGPLSMAALFGIIVDQVGLTLSRPMLLKVDSASRGNPMFALEIARALEREGVPPSGQPLPLPHSLAALVADKISALPEATHDALLTVAASGRAASQAIDLDALEPALAAGVVIERGGLVEFTHPLFAAAAYAQASPARRRRLHARLAETAPDVMERARHLTRASAEPDAVVAAVLHEAAEEARRRGAPEVAAELEQQAADRTLPDDPAVRRERWLRAADHCLHAGDRERAIELAQRVLATPPPATLRARALRLLGEARLQDSYSDASRSFEEALACVQDGGTEAPLLLDVAFVQIGRGDFAAAERHATRATEFGEACGDEPFLAEALAVRTMAHFLATGVLDGVALDRALRLEDIDRQGALWFRPTLIAALLHLYTADLADARRMLLSLRDLMRDRGEDSDLPFVLVNLAWVDVLAGELARARHSVNEALEAAELSAAQTMRGFALAMRALVGAQQGRPEAEADAREGLQLAERTGWLVGAQWSMAALGTLALSRGAPVEAARVLESLLGPVEAVGRVDFATGFFVPDAIEALLEIGEIERAERLTAAIQNPRLIAHRQWNRALAARSRALVEAARRRLNVALDAIDEALEASDSLPIPLERGRTLLIRGELLRRARQKGAAREAFKASLEIFEGLGAQLWATRARAELGRVGHPASTPDHLSETERRVAELAASGLTNREVAARAFLAPKSVESVLERVYGKLGIHSRAELGATIAALPPDLAGARQARR